MAGYTRQDTADNIADTKTIDAADLDAEFDAVEAAFNNSTGHSHDGTAAEGVPIEVTGPNQEYLSEAAQFRPKTDDTYDLGSATFQWKDLYVDGTANIDSLVADTADIDGGTIDNVTIGGTTPAAGSFTNITVSGTVDGRDVAADGTKLDGIEASADVTDTANVTAAGALMDSELTNIAAVKALDQGVATTDSPTFAAITVTGNVDGRDVSVDGTKLDTIETNADVTDTANVTAAGALMDSELTNIAAVKALDQGVATTDSPTFAGLTVGGTDLSGVEANADVTDTANVTAAGALMDSELTDIAAVKALDQGVATTDSPSFTKVSTGDGSAAAPAIIFTSDTDTGLYRRTTDELNLSTGGTERLRFSSEPRAENSGVVTDTSLSVWNTFATLASQQFIAQSTSLLIAGDVTFYAAGVSMYAYSRVKLILTGGADVATGTTQIDGVSASAPFDFISQTPVLSVTGLTPGTDYTAILEVAKGNAAACSAVGLVNYVNG